MIQINTHLANMIADQLRIPGPVSKLELLAKGYSSDEKYVLHSDKNNYLLRINSIDVEQGMRDHFNAISTLWNEGVACPKPIVFDVDEKNGICYMVQTYIQGESAQDVLPNMPEALQYEVGLQAGQELRKIHEKAIPSGEVNSWSIRRKEYKQHREYVEASGVGFRGQERTIKYVKKHLKLLRGRPTAMCHGDYHPGNIVLNGASLVGVIDFQGVELADPFFDFHKAALFAPLSLPYARGQVRGYFGGDPPQDFWPLYNLYIALMLWADLVWNLMYCPENLDNAIKLIELAGDMHEFETAGPPYWWTHNC